jgi:hypothetical protein
MTKKQKPKHWAADEGDAALAVDTREEMLAQQHKDRLDQIYIETLPAELEWLEDEQALPTNRRDGGGRRRR